MYFISREAAINRMGYSMRKQHWNIYLDKGGNFRRTFLPKVYDGRLLIHPFPRINAIWEAKLREGREEARLRLRKWSVVAMEDKEEAAETERERKKGGVRRDDAVVCSFGILHVNFPTDGREHFTGCSDDSIYVYDLKANKLLLRVLAHTVIEETANMDRLLKVKRGDKEFQSSGAQEQ
ncbi:hypothetical protein RHMOL_Rhmol05G0175900 [Rhododendron molle]|uniref:Uncharacterized protein n=1 Tax=Rhododendron molle TaxID=49168 RepID=A0ACC0NQE5_RHOML|nr:hypothetical protein RHMOL_Rhmol05G0175900 [Rhododendron molle]